MISRGCNINFIDFYGATNHGFNLTSSDNVYSDLSARKTQNGYPMQIGILEDENAFMAECTGNNQTHDEVVACIESSLESDMDYVYENYIHPAGGLYWMDSLSGQSTNVVGFFGACGDFAVNNVQILNCPTDWATIWSFVWGYANTTKGYHMEFIFEYGQFDEPSGYSAGVYAWPQPYTTPQCKSQKNCFISNKPSQFYWCDGGILCDGNYLSGAYLDRFYHDASLPQNANYIAVGLVDSGFDDSNAGWGYESRGCATMRSGAMGYGERDERRRILGIGRASNSLHAGSDVERLRGGDRTGEWDQQLLYSFGLPKR